MFMDSYKYKHIWIGITLEVHSYVLGNNNILLPWTYIFAISIQENFYSMAYTIYMYNVT